MNGEDGSIVGYSGVRNFVVGTSVFYWVYFRMVGRPGQYRGIFSSGGGEVLVLCVNCARNVELKAFVIEKGDCK